MKEPTEQEWQEEIQRLKDEDESKETIEPDSVLKQVQDLEKIILKLKFALGEAGYSVSNPDTEAWLEEAKSSADNVLNKVISLNSSLQVREIARFKMVRELVGLQNEG